MAEDSNQRLCERVLITVLPLFEFIVMRGVPGAATPVTEIGERPCGLQDFCANFGTEVRLLRYLLRDIVEPWNDLTNTESEDYIENLTKILSLFESLVNADIPGLMPESCEASAVEVYSSTSDTKISLFGSFTAFPIGGTIGTEFENTTVSQERFDRLEMTIIIQTPSYIEDGMTRPAVRGYLGNSIFLKSIYMVTGIIVAKGARGARERTVAGAGQLQLGIVPASDLGLEIRSSGERPERLEFGRASEFVWGYRPQRVYYRWGEGGGE